MIKIEAAQRLTVTAAVVTDKIIVDHFADIPDIKVNVIQEPGECTLTCTLPKRPTTKLDLLISNKCSDIARVLGLRVRVIESGIKDGKWFSLVEIRK